MSRTLPGTVSGAIVKAATRPAYLLRFSFSSASPMVETLVATWDSNISWNGETWLASGVEVKNLSRTAASITMPTGTADPWLAILAADGFRGRQVQIYMHYTDLTASPQAGAVLVFTGIMNEANITDKISLSVQEKSRAISFPPESMGPPKFNYFLQSGTTIEWAGKTVVVR